MRDPQQVLNALCEHSKNSGYRYERLYRILFNEEMFFIAYQRKCANLQSVGRVPVSSASLGRQRPYSCFGKQGSLQESALGIAFPPLVPEYGFTLERSR